ncbi:helix-turn-helix transcriptional regulator [Leuconostoc gasicomitatum]|uniref:helix-turn-helix domain-containing protein n=1 Tax=Leuconostoc gasicomitatum TaxID=115778 RepID=UPI000BCF5123|nr:helix-turn-helix transcriptional regulator [Leuconostoc gasicomitatum]MBZ5967248.1 helix-turn-helix transcriptional regulator [Leuconostoc gasicomitatum]QFS15376.1 transcriptional regulator [Leuconostoc gasicomitatum]SOB97737.1 DNA-binding helix-turn-helix protein (modular protein) [Leuconostoc gasicomitatum]
MNRLKELRLERGLTLKYMQLGTGINFTTLSKYENNIQQPKLETWELLADYFDVDPEYLVGWSDVKRKELISGTAKNVQQKSD